MMENVTCRKTFIPRSKQYGYLRSNWKSIFVRKKWRVLSLGTVSRTAVARNTKRTSTRHNWRFMSTHTKALIPMHNLLFSKIANVQRSLYLHLIVAWSPSSYKRFVSRARREIACVQWVKSHVIITSRFLNPYIVYSNRN